MRLSETHLEPPRRAGEGEPVRVHLLEEALGTLNAVAGCAGSAVLIDGPQHVLASAGDSLAAHFLRISSQAVQSVQEAHWVGDTTGANDIARSRRPYSAALLPLGYSREGSALVLALMREQPGEWSEETKHAIEQFLPLLRALSGMIHVPEAQREAVRRRRDAKLYQALLDSLADFVWLKDESHRYIAVNRPTASLMGVTPEELLGRTDRDFFPPDVADGFIEADDTVFATREPLRMTEHIASGTEARWVETVKTPVVDEDGAILGITGVARDVTDRHLAHEERRKLLAELAEQHQRLNDMIANVPGVVWEEYFGASQRFVSDRVESLLGYPLAEYLATFHSFLEVVHPDDVEAVRNGMAAQIAARTGGALTFRMRRKDGTYVWCESRSSVILDEDGRVVGLRGVAIDVTSRKLAEDELRASEARFRQVANATPVMIWMTDAHGKAEFQNRRLVEFTGVAEDELHGDLWLKGIHPDDVGRIIAAFTDAHRSRSWLRCEMRYRRYDGEYRDLLVEGAPRHERDGTFKGLVGSCVDMTDWRRLERRIDEQKRMAGLGRLAATIAHEINNVLMAIQPFAEVIARNPPPEKLRIAADRISNAVQRGRRITHEILRYANSAEPVLEPVDVMAWIDGHLHELRTAVGGDVAIELDIEPGTRAHADPHQLQQVFVNLATNARDAMAGAGRLFIRARTEPDWAALADRQTPVVHFVVRDTGPGIPADVIDHIFEPLFTTKHSGTGLGLSIVRDIVSRHGGDIFVAQPEGGGAEFHVILPAASDDVRPQVPEPLEGLPAEVQRVLLVEDDEPVAEGLRVLLELEGASAEIVGRGALALPAIDQLHPDLVILDICLPDMYGTEVFERIRSRHPDLPVIFSTGHAQELEGRMAQLSGPTGYLLKPYEISDLIAAIRRVLAAKH